MDDPASKVGKVTQALSPVKLQKIKVGGSAENENNNEERGGLWSIAREEVSSSVTPCVSNHAHSKKVMKHALRQQAKRRRKNTTIAASNSVPLPRPITVPAQIEIEEEIESRVRPSTMMEVLNSIPGFTLKPRKRSNKKLSPAAQLEQLQAKEGSIDLETPDSILVQTNLRFLLNKHTFASLPPLYQCKLVQLLPQVDRTYHSDSMFRLSASGLNNEFFARALQQWRERLAEGEFTPENQQKLKSEAEKEKSKLDPWKLKHFEPIWGENNLSSPHITNTAIPTVVTSSEWTAPKSTLRANIKLRPTSTARLRTVGAVTRAVSSYRGKREAEEDVADQPKRSKSDTSGSQTLNASCSPTKSGNDEVDFFESTISTSPELKLLSISKEGNHSVNETSSVNTSNASEISCNTSEVLCNTSDILCNASDVLCNTNEVLCNTTGASSEISCTASEVSYVTSEVSCIANEIVCQEEDPAHKIYSIEDEGYSDNTDVVSHNASNVLSESNIQAPSDDNVEIKQEEESLSPNDSAMKCIEAEDNTFNDEVKSDDNKSIENEVFEESNIQTQNVDNVENSNISTPSPNLKTNFSDYSADNLAETKNDSPDEPSVSPAMQSVNNNSQNFNCEEFQTNSLEESFAPKEVSMEAAKGDVQESAWDPADSSTDKLHSDSSMEGTEEGEVAVIPMQEELEVRLEESSLPAPTCEWSDFDKNESIMHSQNPPNSVPYPGHVKLELEVTLTPEVDSQVSSTVESSGAVIAPTTIVCLPTVAAPPLPPVAAPALPPMSTVASMVSSPALPYLALSTSTPVTAVRAVSTKTLVKSGTGPSRNSRNTTNKPPPGAVNLERSYQICQAVIQNSPNRDQLRSQLKPPPSSLISKDSVKTSVLSGKGNKLGVQSTKPARGHPTQPVFVKHVFTSSQGIPVTMAVLPPANTSEMTDGGQFLLVQRGTGFSGVRRSSSAPPANDKLPVGSVARGRPASVGIQAITRDRFNGADSPVQNMNLYNKQQSLDNCSCNLNAMVVCKKCGAFCHDDCISSSRLCLTCLIR